MTPVQHTTKGIQELLDKLKNEGVEEGRSEAARIVEEARREAKVIRQRAEQESESLKNETMDEIRHMRNACDQSLQLAVRDALLRLRSEIENHFMSQIRLLVQNELGNERLVGEWLECIVEHLVADNKMGQIEITVPQYDKSDMKPSGEPTDSAKDELAQHISAEMLNRGITLKASPRIDAGFIVRRVEDGVEIHFEAEALSALLGQHLLPRFRYLLENGPEQPEE